MADDLAGTYRAVYTVKFSGAVFVLHVFQKKSRDGKSTPRMDINLVRTRLAVAEKLAKEMRNEQID